MLSLQKNRNYRRYRDYRNCRNYRNYRDYRNYRSNRAYTNPIYLITMENSKKPYKSIFRKVPKWQDLWFYQKSEAIYQITVVFCKRFKPKYGDRTVDQMIQAARSIKQNIVEGMEDGKMSMEMELRLLNVSRASNGELRQDYEDYLKANHQSIWTPSDERFQPMQDFTKNHNKLSDYEPYLQQRTDEEMANVALTLCFQIDTMMNKYLDGLEKKFVTEGGVKERMHQARTDYRRQQDQRLSELESLGPQLKEQISQLRQDATQLQQQLTAAQAEASLWKDRYNDLKQRALKSYYAQEATIEELKRKIEPQK